MAGPYTTNVTLSNGQNLQIYQAANQAAGTYCPVELNGAVASTSPQDFEVKSPCCVQDIVTPQTSGIIEIISGNGVGNGVSINLDARFVASNPNRQASLPGQGLIANLVNQRIPGVLVPGKRYRIYQKTAGAA